MSGVSPYRCGFQGDDGELQVFDCDGFLMVPVQKRDSDHLMVQPVVMGLTYDQVARAIISTIVAVWREYVGAE